jgi:Protein kinase domain
MLFTHRHRSRPYEEAEHQVPPAIIIPLEDDSSDDDDGNQKRFTRKRHQSRSCLEQLRLFALRGRSSKLLLLGSVAAIALVTALLAVSLLRDTPPPPLRAKPIMMGVFFHDVPSSSFSGRVHAIPPPKSHHEWRQLLKHHSLPKVEPMSTRLDAIEEASDDEERNFFRNSKGDPRSDVCQPQYDWQTKSFPVCNSIHEHSMGGDRMFWKPPTAEARHNARRRRLSATKQHQQPPAQYRLLAHGYWRDTWSMDLQSPFTGPIAFKTMRYEHHVSEYVLDKQRRDALASDRVQFSDQTIHMYAYCGTSALYEYAPGGDLLQYMDRFETDQEWQEQFDSRELLLLAYNVTSALADLHTTEDGHNNNHHHYPRRSSLYPSTAIVHADFNANQFVAVAPSGDPKKIPHFKLGDFNLARMVYWNVKHNHPCVVQTDGAEGQFRAPEEYARESKTEKLDIYSLGNLMYTIVTGRWPWDDFHENKRKRRQRGKSAMTEFKEFILAGKRPHVEAELLESKDPNIQAMLKAMDMCWKQDPHDRSSAREIQQFLMPYLRMDTKKAREVESHSDHQSRGGMHRPRQR